MGSLIKKGSVKYDQGRKICGRVRFFMSQVYELNKALIEKDNQLKRGMDGGGYTDFTNLANRISSCDYEIGWRTKNLVKFAVRLARLSDIEESKELADIIERDSEMAKRID